MAKALQANPPGKSQPAVDRARQLQQKKAQPLKHWRETFKKYNI